MLRKAWGRSRSGAAPLYLTVPPDLVEALLYANLARETLSETLSGQGSYSWPPLNEGDTVDLSLRWAKRIDGRNLARDITLRDLYAVIGRPGNTALTGSFKLHIGEDDPVDGTNVTAAISATATAATWAAALNNIALVGGAIGAATVVLEHGSYNITFAGQTEAVRIRVRENTLSPRSIVRTVAYQGGGGGWIQSARILEAPLAFTDQIQRIVPPAPSMDEERFQDGGEVEGVPLNEIQIFRRPTEFTGIWQFGRNNLRTRALSRADGLDEIKSALDERLADQDGEFLVSLADDGMVLIEFSGSMGATAQDLLEVHIPVDVPGDVTFSLDLSHPELTAALAEKDLLEVEIQIRAVYEADHDENQIRVWSYQDKVRLKRSAHWDGLSTAAKIDFLNPQNDTYVPPPSGPIITGSQHDVVVFPSSGDVGASVFIVEPDLGTKNFHLSIRRNTEPARFLAMGIDYRLEALNDAQYRVTLLPGGYFANPVIPVGDPTKFALAAGGTIDAEAAFVASCTTAGPQSAVITHNQAMSTIDNLLATLEAMQAEIDELKAQAGAGIPFQTSLPAAGPLSRSLGTVWRVPRARTLPTRPASLLEWRATAETIGELPRRPIRLLPAVHASSTPPPLPATLPSLAAAKGKVYAVTTARGDLIGVRAGDKVACDGREFYKVIQSPGTTSYYPAAFETTLFETAINPLEFPARSTLELRIGLELMVAMLEAKAIERRSVCQWTIVLEAGVPSADTTAATTGGNLAAAFTSSVILLKQRLVLTEIPTQHLFGTRIVRAGDGTLTARAIAYGRDEATTAPPSVPFILRGKLTEFDTENAPTDARGVPAVRGLDVGIDGAPDPSLGRLVIS